MNSPLQTDLYQLTMAAAYWQAGTHMRESVFHLFFRRLPFKGGYAIAAGLGPALEWIRDFRFSDSDLTYLTGLVTKAGSHSQSGWTAYRSSTNHSAAHSYRAVSESFFSRAND